MKLAVGKEDFGDLIEGGFTYVDKSLFIEDVINSTMDVDLILRPRRFGKTLNLSMLAHFFDHRRDNRHLFEGLAIESRPCFERCGTHPVLFLSFRDLSVDNYTSMLDYYRVMLVDLYNENREIVEHLPPIEQARFQRILFANDLKKIELMKGIQWLTDALYKVHKRKVILLIDEYDGPLERAYANHFYEELTDFMREALTSALKGNKALKKAVLTGIVRISRESIFSGLNNITVHTVISPSFGDKFGFTKTEVQRLLVLAGVRDSEQKVNFWYSRYKIGDYALFNPWSLLRYLASPNKELGVYWNSTSSNMLVYDLLTNGERGGQEKITKLLQGFAIESRITELTAFRELNNNSLWSLLLFSGYLTAEGEKRVEGSKTFYELRIPNNEVMELYRGIFEDWVENIVGSQDLSDVYTSLIDHDVQLFEKSFQILAAKSMNYYEECDPHPERIYYVFLLGLLANYGESYRIEGNRDSRNDRYDIMMLPKNKDLGGIVIEFCLVDDPGPMDMTFQESFKRIEQNMYSAELKKANITKRTEIAIACCGKHVKVAGRSFE